MADTNRTPVKRANLFARPFLVKGKGKLSTAEASQPRDKVGGFLSLIKGGDTKTRCFQKRNGTVAPTPTIETQCSKAIAQ
jgi:hypothetical protein